MPKDITHAVVKLVSGAVVEVAMNSSTLASEIMNVVCFVDLSARWVVLEGV